MILRSLLVVSTAVLFSTAAHAQPLTFEDQRPLTLTDAQMDTVTAGSFKFVAGSKPTVAGASPVGGQAGSTGSLLRLSFSPNSTVHPNLQAWMAHFQSPVLDIGGAL